MSCFYNNTDCSRQFGLFYYFNWHKNTFMMKQMPLKNHSKLLKRHRETELATECFCQHRLKPKFRYATLRFSLYMLGNRASFSSAGLSVVFVVRWGRHTLCQALV